MRAIVQDVYGAGYARARHRPPEFSKQMAAKDVTVEVHHIRDAKPKELPPADLYLFSSPARFGKPIGGMRRFLKRVELPAGTKYAILTTEAAPTARAIAGAAHETDPVMRDYEHADYHRQHRRATMADPEIMQPVS